MKIMSMTSRWGCARKCVCSLLKTPSLTFPFAPFILLFSKRTPFLTLATNTFPHEFSVSYFFFVSRVVCQKEKIESADYYKLYAFEFNDFDLTDDETILSSLRIMFELGFMNAVHAKLEVNSETLFFYRRCMYVY